MSLHERRKKFSHRSSGTLRYQGPRDAIGCEGNLSLRSLAGTRALWLHSDDSNHHGSHCWATWTHRHFEGREDAYWEAANLDKHGPNRWWSNLINPSLIKGEKQGADHIVIFFCPRECYEQCPAEQGPAWLVLFADVLSAFRAYMNKGMKIFLKACANFENAVLQTECYKREEAHEGTKEWRAAFANFTDAVARLAIFLDTAPGFWKERRSVHNSRNFPRKVTFDKVITQMMTRELCRALMMTQTMIPAGLRGWSKEEAFAAQSAIVPTIGLC